METTLEVLIRQMSALLPEVRIDHLPGTSRVGFTVMTVKRSNIYRPLTGVVGGIVGIAGLAALAFLLLKRRRERENDDVLGPNPSASNTGMAEAKYEPPKLYNPADPSTSPAPVSGRDSSSSGGHTTNPFQPERYSGAP